MINTMCEMFTIIFQRDDVLERARNSGALKRLRDIHPADFTQAIIKSPTRVDFQAPLLRFDMA